MIEKIFWNEGLSIGNPHIDEVHRKLLGILNELVDLTQEHFTRKEFARVLSDLTDYALSHFDREELYMEQFQYPELEKHAQLHKDFLMRVAHYNYDFMGANVPEVQEVLLFVKQWLTTHIMGDDAKYEHYRVEKSAIAVY